MKNLRALSSAEQLIKLFVAAVFVCALSGPVCGQSGSPPPSPNTRRERDLAEREWLLRNIGKGTRKEAETEPPRLTLSQVKKDYEGLQLSNNQILSMLQAGPLNYELIAMATADIKKRAGRLKLALQLPSAEKNEKRVKTADEPDLKSLKPWLLSLDALILRLVNNPIFRDAGRIVDVENSAKAGSDLDDIIELSGRIKRSAEKLGKGAP